MAVRQYIGARYVTKVYENSQDPSSAEWEAGVTYEPLTMVTYNNGSYLSKKDVPGSIGNPASNSSYWVQTGFYNGQIANLQNQIDSLFNGSFRKYIFVGDSYGVDGTPPDERWITKCAKYMGLTLNDTYYQAAAGGVGFANDAFLNTLQAIENNVTDPDAITDIVVCGGYNDNGKTYNELVTAIETFVSYCKATYKNAHVHIGVVGWGADATVRKNIATVVIPAYHDGAIQNGASSIDKAYLTAHNYAEYVYNPGNYGIHPSNYAPMGEFIANYLMGGNTSFHKRETNDLTTVATPYRSGLDTITYGSYNISINDDATTIELRFTMTLSAQNLTARSALPLFTYDAEKTCARINGNLTNFCGMVNILITAGGVQYNDMAFLQDIGGVVRITPMTTRTGVSDLLVQGIQLTIPSIAC